MSAGDLTEKGFSSRQAALWKVYKSELDAEGKQPVRKTTPKPTEKPQEGQQVDGQEGGKQERAEPGQGEKVGHVGTTLFFPFWGHLLFINRSRRVILKVFVVVIVSCCSETDPIQNKTCIANQKNPDRQFFKVLIMLK